MFARHPGPLLTNACVCWWDAGFYGGRRFHLDGRSSKKLVKRAKNKNLYQ